MAEQRSRCPSFGRKYRYASDAEAYAVSVRTAPPGVLQVYRCKTCFGWHVGHPKGSK